MSKKEFLKAVTEHERTKLATSAVITFSLIIATDTMSVNDDFYKPLVIMSIISTIGFGYVLYRYNRAYKALIKHLKN